MAITDVYTYKHMWIEELDKPFDPIQLEYIKNQYDRQVRMNAVYRKLYEEQREVYLKELREFQLKLAAELMALPKQEVAIRLGYDPDTRTTKRDMVMMYVFVEGSNKIESEHSRVKRIWGSMSDEQKEGLG